MTREEAIEELYRIVENQYRSVEKDEEALSMAIKALEQEPTKNDLGVDAVSRKELLKIYEDRFLELQKLKHIKENKCAEDEQLGVNYCINILKEMPSVTPQEPQSEWQHDHEILKAYSDGANEVLDKIRAEIASKIKRKSGLNFTIRERERNDAFLEVLDIIDKYKGESEE